MCLFAVVLLIAAGLKVRRPDGGGTSLTIAIVAVEMCLALWLLSGLAPRWARRAALTLICLFVVIGGWHWVVGAASCGCFGDARVDPLWSVLLDMGMLAAIWVAGRPFKRVSITTGLVRVGLAVTVAMACVSAMDRPARDRVTRLFDADFAVGRSLPLLPGLAADDRADLSHGHRSLILYDHDCDRCRRYLARLWSNGAESSNVRLVDTSFQPTAEPHFRYARLPSTVTVAVTVPLRVELNDGVIESLSFSD